MSEEFITAASKVNIQLYDAAGQLKQEVNTKNCIASGMFYAFSASAFGQGSGPYNSGTFNTLVVSSWPGYHDATYGDYYIRNALPALVGTAPGIGRGDVDGEWAQIANSTYMIDIGTFTGGANNYTATVPNIPYTASIGAGYGGTVKTLCAVGNAGWTRVSFIANWPNLGVSNYGQYCAGIVVLQPSEYIIKGTTDTVLVNWTIYFSVNSTLVSG